VGGAAVPCNVGAGISFEYARDQHSSTRIDRVPPWKHSALASSKLGAEGPGLIHFNSAYRLPFPSDLKAKPHQAGTTTRPPGPRPLDFNGSVRVKQMGADPGECPPRKKTTSARNRPDDELDPPGVGPNSALSLRTGVWNHETTTRRRVYRDRWFDDLVRADGRANRANYASPSPDRTRRSRHAAAPARKAQITRTAAQEAAAFGNPIMICRHPCSLIREHARQHSKEILDRIMIRADGLLVSQRPVLFSKALRILAPPSPIRHRHRCKGNPFAPVRPLLIARAERSGVKPASCRSSREVALALVSDLEFHG